MTALTEILRERASRRGRSAKADCGALGILTVEALTPRDCAALSGKDGRALLYAACRELQQAGESLRQEGLLYTPDEIMQYVTDREAEVAARTVLALSGIETVPAEGPEALAAPSDLTGDQEGPEAADELENPKGTTVRSDGAGETKTPERENPPSEAAAEGKRRLEIVQETQEEFPEVRLETVRQAEPEGRRRPALPWNSGKETGKIRPETVQDGRVEIPREAQNEEKKTEGKKVCGQASYEFSKEKKAKAEDLVISARTQNLVKMVPIQWQDIAVRRKETVKRDPLGTDVRDVGTAFSHEIKSEFREAPHEIESESTASGPTVPHETKSEFREAPHEIKSESTVSGPTVPHEIKSEFQKAPHEVESEFAVSGPTVPHETKSEFQKASHEGKSESCADFVETGRGAEADMERIARMLLEGLRQAAGAR